MFYCFQNNKQNNTKNTQKKRRIARLCVNTGEITEKILSYLNPATLCIVEQVCIAWQQIVLGKDNVLWRRQLEFQLADHQEWEVIYDRCCFHGAPEPIAGGAALMPVQYTLPASVGETWKERYVSIKWGVFLKKGVEQSLCVSPAWNNPRVER